MVARCLVQPWLSGLGSSSGAVHCWDAGSAAGPGGAFPWPLGVSLLGYCRSIVHLFMARTIRIG